MTRQIQHILSKMLLHITWKTHADGALNFIVKDKKLLKVSGSHVPWKSVNISEAVLDKYVITIGH